MTLETAKIYRGTEARKGDSLPWKTYVIAYFNQAAVMVMLFSNVPVLLKQAFGMDWLALTITFLGAMAPVMLRPLLGHYATKHPAHLNMMLLGGFLLLFGGGILNAVAVENTLLVIAGGITTGLILTIGGATLVNVAADTHILRYTSKEKISYVNSRRRLAAIFGMFVGQICFYAIVGNRAGVLFAWWPFLLLTPIFAAGSIVLLWGFQQRWDPLPTGLLAIQVADHCQASEVKAMPKTAAIINLTFIAALAFVFMYNFPSGLVETPWENFLFENYGKDAFATYVLFGLLFAPLTMLGAWFAGRQHGEHPERIFFLLAPISAGFYFAMAAQPAFALVIILVAGLSIFSGFSDVRMFEVMQSRSAGIRGPLEFQCLFATLEIGKYIGVALVAVAMPVFGYSGLFIVTGFVFLAQIGFVLLLLWTKIPPDQHPP